MGNKSLPILAIAVLLLSGCRSEYERIRSSGSPEAIYKKAMAYYDNEDYVKAQGLFELVLPNYRGRVEAEELYYRYAYTYYHTRQYLMASHYFNSFIQTFGASPYKEETSFMSAYATYKQSPSFRLDQSSTGKAIDELQQFINTYPTSARVAECNTLIDELRQKLERKAYDEGRLYFDLKNYQSSVKSFENLLRDFPETANAEQVRYMILKASFLLAENSVVEKQPERYAEALEQAQEFLQKYASGVHGKEAAQIKETSSKKIKQSEHVGYQSKGTRP
jgi:outer membrane protein assembly factor BamD